MIAYTYLGDRLTDPALRGQRCTAVHWVNPHGVTCCVRGIKHTNMLVRFEDGRLVVVLARQLRKLKPTP